MHRTVCSRLSSLALKCPFSQVNSGGSTGVSEEPPHWLEKLRWWQLVHLVMMGARPGLAKALVDLIRHRGAHGRSGRQGDPTELAWSCQEDAKMVGWLGSSG